MLPDLSKVYHDHDEVQDARPATSDRGKQGEECGKHG